MEKESYESFVDESKLNDFYLRRVTENLDEFILYQYDNGKPTVLISSGGTSVPLERNIVRSLENFSTGKRGSISAEEFVEVGYSVIYLHRKGCSLPYGRVFEENVSKCFDFKFLDALHASQHDKLMLGSKNASSAETENMVKCAEALMKYESSVKENAILAVEYTTVFEYIALLKIICTKLQPLGSRAVAFLAAAVSDFYIPGATMSDHKIQSSTESQGNGINIRLVGVPKCLGLISSEWAPTMFRISFKLETDPTLLLRKSRSSIEKYGMHLVVANELKTRYDKVQLVSNEKVQEICRDTSNNGCIESQLVAEIVSLHFDYMAQHNEAIMSDAAAASLELCRRKILERKWRKHLKMAAFYAAVTGGMVFSMWLQAKLIDRVNAYRSNAVNSVIASGASGTPSVFIHKERSAT